MTMKKCITISIFLFIAWSGICQTNLLSATMIWQSQEKIDLNSDVSLTYATKITTTPTRLTVETEEGKMEFEIHNITGTWKDPVQDGRITFDLPVSKGVGKGTIERANDELSITLDFSDRKNGMKKKFIINSYSGS